MSKTSTALAKSSGARSKDNRTIALTTSQIKELSAQEGKYKVKLARLLVEAERDKELIRTLQLVVNSPAFQLVGSVAIAEILEHYDILSSSWATALEGGVITMVGLQALKDHGLLGGAILAGSMGLGALSPISEAVSGANYIENITSPRIPGLENYGLGRFWDWGKSLWNWVF